MHLLINNSLNLVLDQVLDQVLVPDRETEEAAAVEISNRNRNQAVADQDQVLRAVLKGKEPDSQEHQAIKFS